ncbi:MAG TPA: GGDEF domain-containing protein [Actinoplanes sp.]|nr:GGDEF domain-containing protein [Actinoplanes sp.]
MRLRTALLAGLAVAAAMQVLYPFLPVWGQFAISDTVIAVASGYAAVHYHRRARDPDTVRRMRLAFGCGAVACTVWSLGNVVLLISTLSTAPLAGVGGLLSTLAAGFVPIALILAAPRPRGLAAVRLLIDVAAVFGAMFALAWEFVLSGADVAGEVGGEGYRVTIVGLLVLGAVIALVTLASAEPGQSGSAQQLLAAAALVQAVTLLAATRNDLEGNVWHYGGVGGGYILAALVMAASSRLATSRPGDVGARSLVFRGWALLPYVPVVFAVATAAAHQAGTGRLDSVLVWTLLATFSLVLIRQFLTLASLAGMTETLQVQRDALEHQASHDALTGLLNRAAFDTRAAGVLSGPHHGVTAMILDLDGFKPVNDTHGHAAGDDVLIVVARRLAAELRADDLVSRIGGDEFAILLTSGEPEPAEEQRAEEVATEEQSAEKVAGRLLRRISEPMRVHGHTVTVGGSIGLATAAPDEPGDLTGLLRRADTAMYAAKAAGKGTVRRYQPDIWPASA